MTVVLATADFELYYGVVNELRSRGAKFTTVEPGDDLPAGTDVVIRGAADPVEVPEGVEVVVGDAADPRTAVDEALAVGRPAGRRVIGVDPGSRPGIAVLEGGEVVAAFHVPLEDAAATVEREVERAIDPVVRIGTGARLQGKRLIDALGGVRLELVDETGSTPHLGAGARGMGDVLAAVNIGRREGEVIADREIEPTAGEIQRIKTASREASGGRRSITAALARRVAKGELTIEDALAEHRG